MLQINYIHEHKAQVLERLSIKNFSQPELLEEIIQLDAQRRAMQNKLDSMLATAKNMAKHIGRQHEKSDAVSIKGQAAVEKKEIKHLKETLASVEQTLYQRLLLLPNLPHTSVPKGHSAKDNEVLGTYGQIPAISENVLAHWDLAKKYDLIDFALGVKVTGAGFPVYKGKGAQLQRALINFFLDEATKLGYHEVMLPHLVNEDSAFGTGQLPDKEKQMYYIEGDSLYLIPTAEVPMTNLYRDMILKEEELPIKNCSYTPCFRREAGSYGSHVRGLNRLHQFDKVELVQVVHPSTSYQALETMCTQVQSLLQKLALPYRVLRLCGGETGFAAALTYDIETWSSIQKSWLEVSSISNFETFQSNRLKLRFRTKDRQIHLAHTLNGSALALPRVLAALLEQNQCAEGIRIPSVLVPYTQFEWIC